MFAASSSRPRRKPRPLQGWSLALLVLVGAPACDISFDAFSELGDPDPTFVMFPGTRIVEGRLDDLAIDGTEREGAFLLGIDGEHQLTIARLDGGGACRAGPASLYQEFGVFFSRNASFEGYVPYLSDVAGSGRGTLRFTSFDCQPALQPALDTQLPYNGFFTPKQPVFLARGAGGIGVYDPWNDDVRLISTAASVHTSVDHLWSIENGRVVIRDEAYDVIGELGSEVTELAVVHPFKGTGAYIDPQGLSLVTPTLSPTPVPTESDACELSFPVPGLGLEGFAYLSPCSERRLVIYNSYDGSRHSFGSAVVGVPIVRQGPAETYVFYQTAGETGVVTLWGSRLDGAPEVIAEGATLTGFGLPWAGKIRLVLESNGDGGRLVEWQPGQAPRQLASKVAGLLGTFALVDYDGLVGNLVYVLDDGTLQHVASRVPEIPAVHFSAAAFLTDFDGATGTLTLIESSKPARAIASNVPLGTFDFLWQADALVFLENYDSTAAGASLAVFFTETGDRFTVEQPVIQWGEIGWPHPALVYSVAEGPTAGVWVAKLP